MYICTGTDPVQTGGDEHLKQLIQRYTDTWHDDFLRFISDAKCYNSVLNIMYQDRIIVFRPAPVHILQNSIIAVLIIRIWSRSGIFVTAGNVSMT